VAVEWLTGIVLLHQVIQVPDLCTDAPVVQTSVVAKPAKVVTISVIVDEQCNLTVDRLRRLHLCTAGYDLQTYNLSLCDFAEVTELIPGPELALT